MQWLIVNSKIRIVFTVIITVDPRVESHKKRRWSSCVMSINFIKLGGIGNE